MFTVYVSALTFLLILYTPTASRDTLSENLSRLTNDGEKVWIYVGNDERMGGPRKRCPTWKFNRGRQEVEIQTECGRSYTTSKWELTGSSPDIFLYIENHGKRYKLTIKNVTDSDTQRMQLEERNERGAITRTMFFVHYPR